MEANAASVVLIRGGRVLLILRARDPLKGYWTLPGGRREGAEPIAETAAREVREELGLRVGGLRPVARLAVGDAWRLQVFLALGFAGTPTPSGEVADWRWQQPDDLLALRTTPGLAEVLQQAFDRAASLEIGRAWLKPEP